MTSSMALFLTSIAAILALCSAQTTYDCPDNWYLNRDYCYLFEGDRPLSYDNARAQCNLHGAGVLSVDTLIENSFIVQWLQKNDPFQREWYTSGVRQAATSDNPNPGFMWESTGVGLEGALAPVWLQKPLASETKGVIIYTFGKSGPGWKFVANSDLSRPYICKIPVLEAYRILLTNRGFDYGSDSEDLSNIEKGPHFVLQPQSVIVISRIDANTEPVSLDCVVQANPQATYKWFRGVDFQKEVTSDMDSRYSVTNGKLTIINPVEGKDGDRYRCAAENKFGKVISNEVELAFGSLGEFNNVPDAGTKAMAYDGANLQCSRITYKPAISYQWVKGDSFQFVRPEFQDYIFISNNGKLYFSEVTRNDEDDYSCVASLIGVNKYTIGTAQSPMRTSMPIPLVVQDQPPKADWGPAIQNDFIAVFPKPPLRGQDIRMECFAYGSSTSKFQYSWTREDKPLRSAAQLRDHNRVLILPNAQLEDSGVYRCTVSRNNQASDTKTVQLSLGARPYFVSSLQDQHADIDSQLTWICNARANPEPTYRWYKNGELLSTDTANRVRIQKNVLTITKLDPKLHNGMYQCGAENTYGTSLSNAQLRVLAFAPTINKYPPPQSLMAAQGGNVTLRCQPEGSPYPTVEWLKGGSPITSDGEKYTIFGNGNLHITFMSQSDKGTYTCKATNTYGEATASSLVDVTQGASITVAPTDQISVVNRTAFLECEGSFPAGVDMIYDWTFNGFPLDFTDGHYRLALTGSKGLYVTNADFRHEGQYTCTARTPFNSQARSCYLTIRGPPRQPAGVRALSETVTQNSSMVTWMAGSASGGTINMHFIQVSNEFEEDVWTDITNVAVGDSLDENDALAFGKHTALVTGLNPGTAYRFRVIARNEYGRGIPSDASSYVRTLSAPPAVAPQELRGGGGTVGVLTAVWNPLHRSEWGARSVGYRLYWRRKAENSRNSQFSVAVVNDPNANHVVQVVGALNYYLPYEVKIQAFNNMGDGPNSTVVEILSAEEIPIGTPQQVSADTFNATSIQVFWTPVPDDRVHARGKILGYQINYWMMGDDPANAMSINYYGQVDTGYVIGLDVDQYYTVDVMVYNSAGLGPRSGFYHMETSGYQPLHYPQEVHVASAGYGKVRVWWRGVTITTDEEAISGYAIWLWTTEENFYGARLIELSGIVFDHVIHDIEERILYSMRIAAIGGGGYGAKTPTIYFAMEGQIVIDYRMVEAIDILALGVQVHSSWMLLVLCSIGSLVLLRFT